MLVRPDPNVIAPTMKVKASSAISIGCQAEHQGQIERDHSASHDRDSKTYGGHCRPDRKVQARLQSVGVRSP